MSYTTTNPPNIPATDSLDPEVLAFRQAFGALETDVQKRVVKRAHA